MKKEINWKETILETVLDLLFPKKCPVCDNIVGFGKGDICVQCLQKLKFINSPFCMKCGKPLEEEDEYCFDCRRRKHLFRRGIAVFEYRSIASSIYRFKYGRRQEYADFFGKCMSGRLEGQLKRWKAEALVPVPIHPSRKRERGYNQAQLLAKEISAWTGIPMRCDLIARKKKTAPQKDLNDAERQNNLKRAFKMMKNDVKLNTIVIIDDIYTTGSTIDAMAATLQEAGIKNIYFAVLAIGVGQ